MESQHSRGLETKIGLDNDDHVRKHVDEKRKEGQTYLEVLSDLSHEPLERQLTDQKLGGLLVPPDFTECDSSRTEPVGLLDASGGSSLMKSSKQTMTMVTGTFTYRDTLAGLLGGELLAWGLAASRLTGGLL